MSAALLRHGYCPMMLLGMNGLALWLVAAGAPAWWLIGLLAVSVAISFGAERLLPYQQHWNRSHGDAFRDLVHALVNETANFGTLLLLPALTSVLALQGLWPIDAAR